MSIAYVIFGLAIVWVIYYLAWRHGASVGYQEGWDEGYKKGKVDGAAQGIKAGIKEQLLSHLAGKPPEGELAKLEQQARQELLADLKAKPAVPPPKKPNKASGDLLAELWQRFGLWIMLSGAIATVAFLVNRA